MKIAALDIGTNTVLCLIAEIQNGKIVNILSDQAQVVRLGQGMDENKKFHPEALKRFESTLADFRKTIDQLDVDRVVAVATSAARDASNKEEFFKITNQFSIETHVIAGQKEAELTFLGGTFDADQTTGIGIVDVGGGSTEIIFKTGDGEIKGKSLDIGAVRLTERHVNSHPISDQELASVQENIQSELEGYQQNILKDEQLSRLIAVAGTPTTLAAVIQREEFVEEKIHGFELSEQQLRENIESLRCMSIEERRALPGMQKGREDVIVCGASILLGTLKMLNLDSMLVSTKGVRYGLALQAACNEI